MMKKCPYCAEQIQNEAIVCRFCGRDLSQLSEAIYDPKNKTVQKKIPPQIAYLLVTVVFIGLCIILMALTANMPEQKVELSDIAYQDILNKHEYSTDAQWQDYWKSIKGKRVEWTGTISEITTALSTTIVTIVVDGASDINDVTFEYEKDAAVKYNKNERVKFQGTIDSISTFWGLDIKIKDAAITTPPISAP